MKKTTAKTPGKNKGIAIMFTLIMLSVFFLIAFGFISMATSAKAASSAREPQQAAALSIDETVLNQAIFAMDKGLFRDNSDNLLENIALTKLTTANFHNTTSGKEASFKGWGSRKDDTNAFDQTDLANVLDLQVLTTNDLSIDTNTSDSPIWSHLGWIKKYDLNTDGVDDRFCWLILDANGLDPNYAGNSTGHLASRRFGIYARELNMETIDAGFSNAYVDWTAGTPIAWTDKKTLINSLSSSAAASLETAIELFEPGTTPIYIKEMAQSDGKVDLSKENLTASDLFSGIDWLNNSSDSNQAKQIACNIADYLDDNNTVSNIDDQYGKERVPYLNEFRLIVTNDTQQPDTTMATTTTDDDETASEITVEAKFESVNIFDSITTWNEGNASDPNGSAAYFIVNVTVTAERTSSNIDETKDIKILHDFSGATAVGFAQSSDGDETFTSSDESTANNDLSNVNIRVNYIEIYGADNKLWDHCEINEDWQLPSPMSDTDEKYGNWEVQDPRNNNTGWSLNSDDAPNYDATGNDTFGDKNDNYVVIDSESDINGSDGDGEEEPWQTSTAYMPVDGVMNSLAELGMIPRGVAGQTLNMCDYNISASDTFRQANYKPGTLDLNTANVNSTFNGGDRSLLDHVYLSKTEEKTTTNTDNPAYKQFGIINPNTSQKSVIQLLLSDITVRGESSAISSSVVDSVANLYPGIAAVSLDDIFTVDQFHQTSGDEYHNANPTTYGYPFSSMHPSAITMRDAEREFLTVNSMKLVSPKYSYITIIAVVQIMDDPTTVSSTSMINAFVRRDNKSGSFNIIRKTIN